MLCLSTNDIQKIGQRFPIYLSVFDMCWSIFHSIDHWLIVLTQHYPNHPTSDLLGASLQIFLGAPSTMVAIISASVYMNMFKQWRIDFGRYDWKLLSICVPRYSYRDGNHRSTARCLRSFWLFQLSPTGSPAFVVVQHHLVCGAAHRDLWHHLVLCIQYSSQDSPQCCGIQ